MTAQRTATNGGNRSKSVSETTSTATVVVVGCGSEKTNATVAAKDLYTSTYFEKKREYAETVGDSWAILSAKYGSLDPTGARVAPYDLTITDYPIDPEECPDAPYMTIDDWAADFLSGIENRIHNYERWEDHDPLGELVILAGQAYIEPLRDGLDELAAEYGFEVVLPFEETSGIGEQIQWLGEQVERARSSSEEGNSDVDISAGSSDESIEDERGDGATEAESGQQGLDHWS